MTVAEPRAAAATGRCLGAGVLATILLGACGLPFSSTLPSPSLDCQQEDVSGVLSFCGSSTLFPLRGYEIYYKLIGTEEGLSDPEHHNELSARFGRLSAANGTCDSEPPTPPLVDTADAGSAHTVFLDVTFSSTSDFEPFLRLSWRREEHVVVRRGVGDNDNECRSFSQVDGYQSEHPDISDAAVDALAQGALIDIVVYAVSYGLDRGQRLYSRPEWIGRERLVDLPFR